jgi:hypothetical protein
MLISVLCAEAGLNPYFKACINSKCAALAKPKA